MLGDQDPDRRRVVVCGGGVGALEAGVGFRRDAVERLDARAHRVVTRLYPARGGPGATGSHSAT